MWLSTTRFVEARKATDVFVGRYDRFAKLELSDVIPTLPKGIWAFYRGKQSRSAEWFAGYMLARAIEAVRE